MSRMSQLLTRLAVILLFCIAAISSAQQPKVRLSAWYWLNSAPKVDWEGDFVTMKALGYTDVVLAWGLDLTGVITRPQETRDAIRLAHKARMRAYLIVWHPIANTLPRRPEFMQVDSAGKTLETFDVFNRDWRASQWKDFLQQVARTYGKEPGMAGYVFDDSFSVTGNGIVSYGEAEKRMFGGDLPRKPGDARWDDWVKARQGWWEEWAADTVKFIREADPDSTHEIYIEDLIGTILNPNRTNNIGLDFGRVAKHFDAVGGYTTAHFTSAPDSDKKAIGQTIKAITEVQKMAGPDKKIIYTFWIANPPEERKPGPAVYPTAAQIKQICDAALNLGIRHLDMYGYRIGDPAKAREDWAKWIPAEPAPYLLTGQFPQKFLWDRPQVQQDLGDYLLRLNQN